MSVIPSELAHALESHVGPLQDALRLSGGMVASSAMIVTAKGRFFVKWKLDAPRRFFRVEADGLDRLSATRTVKTPRCIAYQDADEGDLPYLLLEYVEPTQPTNHAQFDAALGEGLAALHRINPSFTGFGLEIDNYLGSQPQANQPMESWPGFYRERRLLPQVERARRLGLIPTHRARLLDLLLDRLESVCEGHSPGPALIHGDLWAGNLITTTDGPVLIDPAVYYADREMEIAYMQLFNGFSGRVFAAYEAAYPLPEGYERRRPLHQLYPLLIHLNHFGERSYGNSIDAVCRFYLSA
jgi:fructosamine-3-kinase